MYRTHDGIRLSPKLDGCLMWTHNGEDCCSMEEGEHDYENPSRVALKFIADMAEIHGWKMASDGMSASAPR